MEEDRQSLDVGTHGSPKIHRDGHNVSNPEPDRSVTVSHPGINEHSTDNDYENTSIISDVNVHKMASDNVIESLNVNSKDDPPKRVSHNNLGSCDTTEMSQSTKASKTVILLNKESPAEVLRDAKTQDSPTTINEGDGDSHDSADKLASNEQVTITIDVGGGGDRIPLAGAYFNPSDSVRFQRMVLEVVEELRMRRAMDSENEDRMRQLMNEKHDLDTRYHDATSKISNMEKMILEKVAQTRRESQSTIQDLTDEKAKLLSSYESSEKDVKSLKDEIRALQLNNYTLEKKVREQERKSEMATSTSDSHLAQIPALEMKCAAVVKKTEDLSSACTKLDKNVKEACRLNTRLIYENEHKNCEVDRYRAELNRLATELREARAETAYEPEKLKHEINLLETQVAALKKQVQTENGISTSLRKLLAHSRSEKNALSERLSEAHSLIAQQTEQASQGAEEFDTLKQRFSTLEGEKSDLDEKYGLLVSSSNEERAKHSKEFDELHKKAEHGHEELELLRTTHNDLLKNHEELQQLNSTWAKKNVELSEQVSGLKAELEKPKCEAGVQVVAECLEAESQTEASVSSTCVQTVSSCLQTVEGEAQTLYQATVCSSSQTQHVALVCADTQTLVLECEDKYIQTTHDESSDVKTNLPVVNSTNRPEDTVLQDHIVEARANSPSVRIATPPSTPVKLIQEPKELTPLPTKPSTEQETSPYSRFSASLRCLRSKPRHPSATAKTDSNSTPVQDKQPSERPNRLKLRSSEQVTKVVESNSLPQQSPGREEGSAKAGTGRFSFQFLHIPELERCPTSTPDGDTVKPAAVSVVEAAASANRGDQVVELVSSGKRPAPSSDPMIPGILSGPRASKPKRPKKVHFAASPGEDKMLLMDEENSDSEELFSEDEANEDIELRQSQVTRIEHVLSE